MLEKGDVKQTMQHVKNRDARRNDLQQQQQKLQRKQAKNLPHSEDEVRVAREKVEEASLLARTAVDNFFETEPDQIAILKRFVESQLQMHARSVDVLERLDEQLREKKRKAEEKPRKAHVPKKVFGARNEADDDDFNSFDNDDDDDEEVRRITSTTRLLNDTEVKTNATAAGGDFIDVLGGDLAGSGGGGGSGGGSGGGGGGRCVALYDFVSETESDLNLVCGDVVEILERVDENWLRGRKEKDSTEGLFPKSFVEEY